MCPHAVLRGTVVRPRTALAGARRVTMPRVRASGDGSGSGSGADASLQQELAQVVADKRYALDQVGLPPLCSPYTPLLSKRLSGDAGIETRCERCTTSLSLYSTCQAKLVLSTEFKHHSAHLILHPGKTSHRGGSELQGGREGCYRSR